MLLNSPEQDTEQSVNWRVLSSALLLAIFRNTEVGRNDWLIFPASMMPPAVSTEDAAALHAVVIAAVLDGACGFGDLFL